MWYLCVWVIIGLFTWLRCPDQERRSIDLLAFHLMFVCWTRFVMELGEVRGKNGLHIVQLPLKNFEKSLGYKIFANMWMVKQDSDTKFITGKVLIWKVYTCMWKQLKHLSYTQPLSANFFLTVSFLQKWQLNAIQKGFFPDTVFLQCSGMRWLRKNEEEYDWRIPMHSVEM